MLKKLMGILGLGSGAEKNGTLRDPASALKKVHLVQLQLATQIKAHAELAPYPHVTQRLIHLANEKLKSCEALREALRKLGSYVGQETPTDVYVGGNHWERMSRDVHDQSALVQTLTEFIGLLLHEAPEVSDLLSRVLAEEQTRREVLIELLMRADPQAHQI